MVSIVFQKMQFWVVITVVKKMQFWVVIMVVNNKFAPKCTNDDETKPDSKRDYGHWVLPRIAMSMGGSDAP